MSDVVPSFFPTPHEIAGGLRWVREHPVVATAAAAAATAVSVITFLRAQTLADEDDELQLPASPVNCAPFNSADDLPDPRPRFATWSEHYPPPLHTARNPNDSVLSLGHRRIQSQQDFTLHKARKEAEDVYSNTDSEFSAASPHTSRRNSPASSDKRCDAAACFEESLRDVNVPPTCFEGDCYEPEDDPDSASPQWGWYVSTTPPDEQYS